jgi:predicted esterase YcpF (UPF0227 family)
MNIKQKLHQYQYIYLHGFASSPKSGKAIFLFNQLQKYGIELLVPDLNQNDFYNLTLTRQLNQVKEIIQLSNKPVILFGASMGGITSALLAETEAKVVKNILFAPAFNLSNLWDRDYNNSKINDWKEKQTLTVFHYGEKKELQLHYNFYLDLLNYRDVLFHRNISTLIYHGTLDNVVPLDVSKNYLQQNSNAKLVVLEDDHGVSAFLEDILPEIIDFIVTTK